mmetsp:Transcript_15743/g.36665  ORF Transcript_15743/g.36665 Transcript_15743/m.36665 type:complete len:236 (+) Transcript_15743:886-1593(+)
MLHPELVQHTRLDTSKRRYNMSRYSYRIRSLIRISLQPINLSVDHHSHAVDFILLQLGQGVVQSGVGGLELLRDCGHLRSRIRLDCVGLVLQSGPLADDLVFQCNVGHDGWRSQTSGRGRCFLCDQKKANMPRDSTSKSKSTSKADRKDDGERRKKKDATKKSREGAKDKRARKDRDVEARGASEQEIRKLAAERKRKEPAPPVEDPPATELAPRDDPDIRVVVLPPKRGRRGGR